MKSIYIGLGNYRLAAQFTDAARSCDEISLISSYSPEEIVEKVFSTKTTESSKVDGLIEG